MFSLGKSLLTYTTSQFLDPSRGGFSHDLHRYRDVVSGVGSLELGESGRVGERCGRKKKNVGKAIVGMCLGELRPDLRSRSKITDRLDDITTTLIQNHTRI
jgi:hypothetical protein